MNLKFWQKDASTHKGASSGEKLSKPVELPGPVGRDIVVLLKKDPDWAWKLKCVERLRAGEAHLFDVRIYSPSLASDMQVQVKNFHSLDDHPELILFQGWYNNKTMKAQIEEVPKSTPKPSPLAA